MESLSLFFRNGENMNKEYIKTLLQDEEMINKISKLRTQFSLYMSEFYFFRTFFEALKSVGINGHTDVKYNTYNGLETSYFIILCKDDIELRFQYDNNKFQDELSVFNKSQSEMGFRESAIKLTNIFINLLES